MKLSLSLRCALGLAALLFPAVASAEPSTGKTPARATRAPRTARVPKPDAKKERPCLRAPVEIVAGAESASVPLARCDGSAPQIAVDQLSMLARPSSAPKPKDPIETFSQVRGAELAPGIRRIDPRLVAHLALAVEHFRKAGQPARVFLVSGYRPRSAGSYHAAGRALDFRIDGVNNDALVSFCKTLPDTGCGYYPNSVFVHMDVRDAGTGHVSWVDVSRPGETPKYVSEPTTAPATIAPAAAAMTPIEAPGGLPALPGDGGRASTDPPKPEKPTKPAQRPFFL